MSKARFVVLSLAVDALLVNAGIVLAFVARFGGELPEFNFGAYIALAPVLTLVYTGAFYIYGLYEPERMEGAWTIVAAAARAVTLGTILTAAISFFAGLFSFSRLVIVIAWVFHMALIVGWRLAAHRLTPIHWPEQRLLVVGGGQSAADLVNELAGRAGWGYRVVGLVGTLEEGMSSLALKTGVPVLGDVSELDRIVTDSGASRVIIASPGAHRELVENLALDAEVRIDVIPELYEIFIGQVDTVVSDIPLMALTKGPAPSWFFSLKRAADIVLSLALLVVLGPFVVLAALAVLLSSGAPAFFRQERVGRALVPFNVIKLRTMIRDAESESGPVLAEVDDARVTPVGRFLRRYRIDELPQLVNILRGDMSFVGPRPERPEFVEEFARAIPGYRERFKVKPGATGLAQVSGSYATTPERKLKYDLIYMYHQSLLMDFSILVRTVRVVLTGRGAR